MYPLSLSDSLGAGVALVQHMGNNKHVMQRLVYEILDLIMICFFGDVV